MNTDSSRLQKADKHRIDMLHGKLVGKILLFAIPLTLSIIFQQLLNTVDTIVAGRFVSSQSLAGIGATTPVIATFLNFVFGLSIGANVLVAMRIGENNEKRVSDAVHTTILLAIISGIILVVVGLIFSPAMMEGISMPDDSIEDALAYIQVYFCGTPFLILYNFASALLRAKGDTRRPLYALIAGVALNTALDLVFTLVFGWGTAGIALATDLANVLSAIIVLYLLMQESEPFRLHMNRLSINGASLRIIMKIGVPAGLQSALFSLSNVVVQAAINGFLTPGIAGSTAAVNAEYYTYFFVNAFSQTAVTFIGQNYAAKQTDRCDTIVKWCLLFGIAFSAALSIVLVAMGENFLMLFTTDEEAIRYGMIRLYHVELLICLTALYEIPGSAMRGMGWSMLPAIITILGSVVLRIYYVYVIFAMNSTFEALMDVYPISWVLMAIVMFLAFFLVRRHCYKRVRR